MKDEEYLNLWLHGTLRAWLASDEPEALRIEALTLIWVLDQDATWAGARDVFEQMVTELRAELHGVEGGEG